MKIHKIIPDSEVNGPGKRWVVWVQGCSIHCSGCSNFNLWPFQGGQEMSPQSIVTKIPSTGIEGLTVTGGEPFDQSAELRDFLKIAYNKVPSVMVTTGYLIKDICTDYIDILIDGPYMKDKPDNTPSWRGSTNQGIYFLTERGKKYQEYKSEYGAELCFDGSSVEITGFGVPSFIKEGFK